MSFEDIDAEITLLLKDLEEDYGDQHEALERIRQMIEKTKAYGMEPPQELVTLVGVLEQESRGEEAGKHRVDTFCTPELPPEAHE